MIWISKLVWSKQSQICFLKRWVLVNFIELTMSCNFSNVLGYASYASNEMRETRELHIICQATQFWHHLHNLTWNELLLSFLLPLTFEEEWLKTHCSKSSFFVQKFNFDFPRKLSKFWVKNSCKCQCQNWIFGQKYDFWNSVKNTIFLLLTAILTEKFSSGFTYFSCVRIRCCDGYISSHLHFFDINSIFLTRFHLKSDRPTRGHRVTRAGTSFDAMSMKSGCCAVMLRGIGVK